MRSLRFSDCRVNGLHGKISYFHNGKETSSSAFEIDEAAFIRILLPRALGVVSVYACFSNENLSGNIAYVSGDWVDSYNDYDVYDFKIDIRKIGIGLFFYKLRLETAYGKLYGYKAVDRVAFSTDENVPVHFQFSVSDFLYKKPDSRLGGVIYHIFVDRFNKGGSFEQRPGTVLDDDWRVIPEFPLYPGAPLKNNHFYGGTLWGIIEKLDYIKSLGVNLIYLSPIFDAASNHKYDTGDYMSVDKMFGGDKALTALIKKAKEYKIGIILDGVFNHTGSDSIYFNKYKNYRSVGAYQSEKSKYYTWYDFQDYPDKYTSWWGIDILPRIHPDVPECRDYFVGDGGVIEKYAKKGIAGFRLDVADELSDEFIGKIKEKLNEFNDESILYGEVWEDASNKIAYDKRKSYYLGSELDGVMNYPIRTGIIDYLTNFDTSTLRYALTDVTDNAPKRIRDTQMNLLGTHDTARILTVLGGEKAEGRSNEYLSRKKMNDLERGTAKRRLRMAYAILATLPGIPTIFYGDEAGLEGYSDPFNRMPYPWGHTDQKLINYYKKLGKIRNNHDVYKDGDFTLHYLDQDSLVYSRYDDEYAYVTFVNNSGMAHNIVFSCAADALILDYKKVDEFVIEAYSAEIFKIKKDSELHF